MNMKQEKIAIPKEYADIIHLPHHVSDTRPQMAVGDRAAQFSPFAALTGYDAAIKETGRLTDSFIELDDNQKSILNEKDVERQNFIIEALQCDFYRYNEYKKQLYKI